jgi:hypothetical protein
VGDRRLEMVSLRELAGDVPLALGLSIVECTGHLRAGLAIAEHLADRTTEADLLGRLAVLASNRLRFTESLAYSRRAVAVARTGTDERALAAALDGLKNSYAYLGEIGLLTPVLDELEPLLRQQGDLWRLQWTVYEAAFPAIAAARWDEAASRIAAALDVNRRSGYTAYEGWFIGNLGWVHRMRGRYEEALRYGRQALALTGDSIHPWWRVAACTQLAGTLLEIGGHREAAALLEEASGHGTGEGGEAYLLGCLAPLAAATGSRSLLEQADALVAGIDAPPGSAWLFGADAYLAVARGWLDHGEPARARSVLAPVLAAAGRVPWLPVQVASLLLDARAAHALGEDTGARFAAAETLARRHGLGHLVARQEV